MWVIYVLIALVVIFAVAFVLLLLWGRRLPSGHRVSRTITLERKGVDEVWHVIRDYAGQTKWRSKLKHVEEVSGRDGRTICVEKYGSGKPIRLETTLEAKPLRLVRTIINKDLPFGGCWEFDLHPVTGGTRLTMTEDGEVYNPLFRSLGQLMRMKKTANIDGYLRDLGKLFGQPVEFKD